MHYKKAKTRAPAVSSIWTNSRGQQFDLSVEKRYSPGEAAMKMRRSTEWVLRLVRSGELSPVCRLNCRTVEIYDCAISDFYARRIEIHAREAA